MCFLSLIVAVIIYSKIEFFIPDTYEELISLKGVGPKTANLTLAEGFNIPELSEVLFFESKLFFKNAFGFRQLAFEEMRKYNKDYFVSLAQSMVQQIDPAGFTTWTAPGIRAQLLDKETLSLVQDFVVEGDKQSVHVLNAVSPAFTCSFVFSKYVVDHYVYS